jgi:trehalose-6-phosphatase
LRIVEGPLAVEVTVAGTWTKGDAVRQFLEHVGEPLFVCYAGDADNDSDAFRLVTSRGGITLGVGPLAPSDAAAHFDEPSSLMEWLEELAEALPSIAVET